MMDIDVEKLEANKQTDALVAEMVMGWRSEIVAGDTVIWHSPRTNGVMAHGGIDIVPPYSTDIGAAWQIADGLLLITISKQLPNERGRWRAECNIKNPAPFDGYMRVIGEADTAPLALCRLALKAFLTATKKEG